MPRIVLLVVTAMVVSAATATPAAAHSAAWAFPVGTFLPPFDRQEFRFHTTVPTGGWRDRINAGAGEWNRYNRRFTFVPPSAGAPSTTGPTTYGCPKPGPSPRPSIIYRADAGDGPASASPCFDRTHDHPTYFRIWFAPRKNYWWTRESKKIPIDRYDLQSIAVHEFGHALGFLPHYDDDGPDKDDPPRPEYKSYCRVNRDQQSPVNSGESRPYVPHSRESVNTAQETMCIFNPRGTVHMRTLASHDRGTFRNAYPPR